MQLTGGSGAGAQPAAAPPIAAIAAGTLAAGDGHPLLRRGGASAARGHTAGRTHGPRRLAAGRTAGRRCARGPPACGRWATSHYRKRKYEASLDLYQESLAIYQRLGNDSGGRPHAQQFPAEPDLPGPLPGSDGVRAAGAPDLRAAGRPAPPGPAGRQRGQHPLPPGPLRRGAGTVPARLRRFSGDRRTAGYRHLAQEHGYLPDQPQRLSAKPWQRYQKARAYCVLVHRCRCWWRWPTTTSPTCTTCAANTRDPSNSIAPPARTAATWATPIARRSAISISPRCTWS